MRVQILTNQFSLLDLNNTRPAFVVKIHGVIETSKLQNGRNGSSAQCGLISKRRLKCKL
jgi:hypothetical protein